MVFNVGVVTLSWIDCQEVLVALDLSEDIEPLGNPVYCWCIAGSS